MNLQIPAGRASSHVSPPDILARALRNWLSVALQSSVPRRELKIRSVLTKCCFQEIHALVFFKPHVRDTFFAADLLCVCECTCCVWFSR